jgi:hypothetical protein
MVAGGNGARRSFSGKRRRAWFAPRALLMPGGAHAVIAEQVRPLS